MPRLRLSKPRRIVLVVAAVATAGLVAVASAYGIGATLDPGTQSVCSGCSASWGGAWSGVSPYNVTFSYGDGTSWTANGTTSTSHGWSDAFYTCTGQTYNQHLHVQDHNGSTADAYASTLVSKGNICAPGS
ncbi:MAG: hypothetical protein ACYDCH_10540 [Gaiellaceae bacterium]